MKLTKHILEAINRGILLALDDYQDNEQISSLSPNDVINTNDVIKNKIELMKNFINLGLPSGTLWCKYNLGVNPKFLHSADEWYGNYYAFGELNPITCNTYKFKEYYSNKSGAKLHRYTKYNMSDKLKNLELCDDPAYNSGLYKKYNANICVPNMKLYEELLLNTTKTFLYGYKNISNLYVCILKSKINGNEIVFPIDGYIRVKDSVLTTELTNPDNGYYMSSNIYSEGFDWLYYSMQIEDNKCHIDTIAREHGVMIRPVLMK